MGLDFRGGDHLSWDHFHSWGRYRSSWVPAPQGVLAAVELTTFAAAEDLAHRSEEGEQEQQQAELRQGGCG